MNRICAIVVTYNRGAFLETCIHRLLAQTRRPDRIYVVNNNSTDHTADILANLTCKFSMIEVLEQTENLGPAGGYMEGMKKALEMDYDHLWIMDDDVFAEYECLEELLKLSGVGKILYPTVRNVKNEIVHFPAWAGLLLSAGDVRKMGYTDPEYFFWGEEIEYLQHKALNLYTMKELVSEKAHVTHLMLRPEQMPAWQYYYKIRNLIHVRINVKKDNYYKLPKAVIKLFFRIILLENNKMAKMRLFLTGVHHGFAGKRGKLIDPVEYNF